MFFKGLKEMCSERGQIRAEGNSLYVQLVRLRSGRFGGCEPFGVSAQHSPDPGDVLGDGVAASHIARLPERCGRDIGGRLTCW